MKRSLFKISKCSCDVGGAKSQSENKIGGISSHTTVKVKVEKGNVTKKDLSYSRRFFKQTKK